MGSEASLSGVVLFGLTELRGTSLGREIGKWDPPGIMERV